MNKIQIMLGGADLFTAEKAVKLFFKSSVGTMRSKEDMENFAVDQEADFVKWCKKRGYFLEDKKGRINELQREIAVLEILRDI